MQLRGRLGDKHVYHLHQVEDVIRSLCGRYGWDYESNSAADGPGPHPSALLPLSPVSWYRRHRRDEL
jgi:hypothetical protein